MRQSTPQIRGPSSPEPAHLGPSPTILERPQPNPLPAPSASARPQPMPAPPPPNHSQRIHALPPHNHTEPIPARQPRNHANPIPGPAQRSRPTLPPPAIRTLDTELHRLARGAGRLRLRIGQALHRLGGGIHELGFSTLGAYALERCNRGGRWAAESRTLARRLEALPQLTTALETGAIGWSMAELLARHATPQTEAALLQIARSKTVQAMRIALSPANAQRPQGASTPLPDEDDDLTRTLSLTLPLEEAWALEATRMMIDHMDGKRTGAHFLESLLAEATIPLLDLTTPAQARHADQATHANESEQAGNADQATHANESDQARKTDQANESDRAAEAGEADITTQMEAEHAAWRAQMHRLQHLRAEAELQSRPQVPTNFTTEPDPGEAPNTDDLPTTLEALDARIRHYSAELASRDLFFGRLAQRFLALRGWQTLGFTTEAHYARERLGMSRASLRSKVTLARRTEGLRHTTDALQQGHIGFEAAQLIARIATPTTEHAWLGRATHRTFKHLREEVQAVETLTRFTASTDRSPPTEAQIADVQALERAILSGELLRRVVRHPQREPTNQNERSQTHEANAPTSHGTSEQNTVQISVTPNNEPLAHTAAHASGSPSDEPPTVQISVTPAAKVTLRIRVPGDLLLHYRQLERLHRQKLPGESFIQFLRTEFWQTWVPTLGVSDKWEHIYRRDRYRCTNPVCHQRNITLHHVKYRANGGTDEADNLTSPCAFCHLEGEHGGRLKILPPGSDPTWLLGRHPIMRIHHRERTLLA